MAKNQNDNDNDGGDGEETRTRQSRETDITIKGLPEGIRAVLRSTPWRDKEFETRIYRMVPNPIRRGRDSAKYIRTEHNLEVTPDWLQDQFGGGRFQAWYYIEDPKGKGQILIATDTFDIEADPFGNAPPAAPGIAAPPVPAQAGAGVLADSVALLGSLANIVATLRGEPAGPGMGAGNPALAVSEQFYKDRVSKLDAKEKEIDNLKLKLEATIAKSNNGLPDAMKPFSPLIEAFSAKIAQSIAGGANGAAPNPMLGIFTPMLKGAAAKLIGDTEEATILRGLVFNSPEFQAIWSDTTKRAGVASYVVGLFPDVGPDLVKAFMAMTPNPA